MHNSSTLTCNLCKTAEESGVAVAVAAIHTFVHSHKPSKVQARYEMRSRIRSSRDVKFIFRAREKDDENSGVPAIHLHTPQNNFNWNGDLQHTRRSPLRGG
jgi:hypothetical protein